MTVLGAGIIVYNRDDFERLWALPESIKADWSHGTGMVYFPTVAIARQVWEQNA